MIACITNSIRCQLQNGADDYNKVLTGIPGYAAISPSLEDQGFIFLAPSPMQSKEGMIIAKLLFSKQGLDFSTHVLHERPFLRTEFPEKGSSSMKAAFIIFDRLTSLDLIGFYDPVTRLKSMNILPDLEWRICSNKQQITDDRGLVLTPDSINEPLDGYNLLFVPGGFGTRELQHDLEFIEWLKSAASVELKTSVCTGALLLGAAGFLRGKRATTHPSALKELEPYCDAIVRERVVDEGNVITAGGVSASIDLGLHVVQRLAGTEARSRIAKQMDYPYQWDP